MNSRGPRPPPKELKPKKGKHSIQDELQENRVLESAETGAGDSGRGGGGLEERDTYDPDFGAHHRMRRATGLRQTFGRMTSFFRPRVATYGKI